MSKLRFTIGVDLNGDERPDLKITPVVHELDDEDARTAAAFIALLDRLDGNLDGKAEVEANFNLPKAKVWFLTVGGQKISLDFGIEAVEG